MTANIAEIVNAGQAIYTKSVLAIYDILVLGISHHFLWECPTSKHLDLYNRHISDNHLDIGIGTGFYLDNCKFSSSKPKVALMDLNPNCLEATSRRIARYQPETYIRNILKPISLEGQKFNSIGLNCVLHCLPGTIQTKAVVFKNIKHLLNPGAIVFGSTVLNKGVKRNIFAQWVIDLYVKKGIFSNQDDSLEDLKQVMESNFSESSIETIGCTALFWGRV
ncbi:class I SAM-dependent methyltransferase [Nostoc cf. edaphicum LEGE 07299]|uniref:Class I SAM-dependent methyltransferase n=1 Tax=Nostoc cf. edaphicum LEGE 07299 TaxID=2777974 RepID=A0ABR9TWN6_9NOSO|nr:class I SAM-dependent methyltransferase [Nostoc edaphicum]MBE9104763.1 class I SAM-dependent methyltransferase [Nostoc cf. edaphicum LEGE 07299]